ncbi:MAG TPA: hypothetical protein VF636_01975 [Sphingomonas sp.]
MLGALIFAASLHLFGYASRESRRRPSTTGDLYVLLGTSGMLFSLVTCLGSVLRASLGYAP